MPLTDVGIRRLKAGAKDSKHWDERGLYLLVASTGGKLWRWKYRFAGKEKLLALGKYPDVSLADARTKREDARKQLAAGIDPSEVRRSERNATSGTFEAIAREWFETNKAGWSKDHSRTVLGRLEDHLFPRIGSRQLRDLTAPDILEALRVIEKRGNNETARRVRQISSEVFRYAIASGRADRDPAADLRGALAPVQSRNHAAVTDPKELGALLAAFDSYQGTLVVKCALRLAPVLFVRPGELRQMEWTEVDLEKAEWTLPAWKMKSRRTHTVPLSRQAIEILREIQPVTNGGRYVFPSARGGDRPMSNNAILAALRRSGIPKDVLSGHGFRAAARTILDEVLQERVELIEHQLAHAVKDPTGRAYNRTSFLPERVQMMQRWSDFLDTVKKEAITAKQHA